MNNRATSHAEPARANRTRPTLETIAAATLAHDAREDAAAIVAVQQAIDAAVVRLGRTRTRKLMIEAWSVL